MVEITAEQIHEGKQVFDLITESYPGFKKRDIIKSLQYGFITLNGSEAYGDDTVHENDKIQLFLTGDVLGVELKPEIIYHDENLVIADKPAGLLCISENGEPNAVSIIEEFMKQRGEYSLEALLVPYLVYPLEKYVNGLIMLAKHEDAYIFLAEALSQRRISRHYICACVGAAKEKEELLAYHILGKTRKDARIVGFSRKDAKPIVTRYTTISSANNISLLNVRPITNTLHQVRAHLAFEGLPIVGDEIYGDSRFNRKHRAGNIALWLKTMVFEVGRSHEYEYLNGKKFESGNHSFPKCVYDAGLPNI